jgi:predicted RNA-binding protein with RPS1 domain
VKREIVINASALEVRVALLEDGSLAELYVERQQHRGLAGNIYKGKVTRVLPGMQAAFVDIGLEKAGFLHVSDFHDDVQALGSIAEVIGEEDVETEPVDGYGGDEAKSPTDLQELAELEEMEEPHERQDPRQDLRNPQDSQPLQDDRHDRHHLQDDPHDPDDQAAPPAETDAAAAAPAEGASRSNSNCIATRRSSFRSPRNRWAPRGRV